MPPVLFPALVFSLGLVIQIWPSGVAINTVLKRWFSRAGQAREQIQLNAPAPGKISTYIGILERLIIFAFVWHGAYEATSFIITGKALLRFREANEERHSEYILVGTLLSAACAILSAIALSRLAHFLPV